MIEIHLPDGSVREYERGVTPMQVAESIGPGLAKVTVAARFGGVLVDWCDSLDQSGELQILTAKDKDGLDVIRHSCAHLFGHAVKQLKPEVQMVIGPVIENGFYYDVFYPQSLHPEDLESIEAHMRKLASSGYAVKKVMTPRAEARQIFTERHELYKVRLIDDLEPDVEQLGLYYHEEYIDMCRGPHVPHMGHVKAFKLTHLAGSYWRGDAQNEVLQRVYGTCWVDEKSLNAHLQRLAEAKKRDHRALGARMDLFHTQEEAPGMAFWRPHGAILYNQVVDYLRQKQVATGFFEVRTPLVLDVELWKRSGHWDKYRDNMFFTSSEKRDYAVKPMNCPGHLQIFNQTLRSYRDLPLRLAEFGLVHRNEPSGTLHGLMRVRSFTQDDSHIFCTPEQVQEEVRRNCEIIFAIYRDFGFDDIAIMLSTRPDERIGSDADWDAAEGALEGALQSMGVEFEFCPGEGAFYGPKLEFSLTDAIGRVWQCGTIQMDFFMPERLHASYVDADGERKPPIMIHRAVIGSIERFIGVLVEHYAGFFPLWLAPVQAVVATITERHNAYAQQLTQELTSAGLRVENDLRNEKVGYKIRELGIRHVPFVLVVGDKEMADRQVAVRDSAGKNLGAMDYQQFIELVKANLAARSNSHQLRGN